MEKLFLENVVMELDFDFVRLTSSRNNFVQFSGNKPFSSVGANIPVA